MSAQPEYVEGRKATENFEEGMKALSATGPLRFLGGTVATLIYYDYHSDRPRVH